MHESLRGSGRRGKKTDGKRSEDENDHVLGKPKPKKALSGSLATELIRVGKKDGAPVSVWNFSVTRGPQVDEREMWVSHPDPETVYVLSGRFHYEMVTPDCKSRSEFDVGPGDVLYVAPGTYHRGRSVGAEAYTGIIFTPKAFEKSQDHIYTERLPCRDGIFTRNVQ
jgi:quercetin dioxygenase-like cupin family protein